MAKLKVVYEELEPTNGWLITFNDLMTLLLTFFVLLLSMSSLDAKKLKEFQSNILSALGVLEYGKQAEESIIEKMIRIEDIGRKLKIYKNILPPVKDALNDESLVEQETGAEELLKKFELLKQEGRVTGSDVDKQNAFRQLKIFMHDSVNMPGLTVIKQKRGVVLRLPEAVLFDPGDDGLKAESLPLLKKVADIINGVKLYVYIEGHTDSRPVNPIRFSSNWELSVARAVSVVDYFINQCAVAPSRIGAAGYGASRPVAPNDTPDNRRRNRRIEIILSRF